MHAIEILPYCIEDKNLPITHSQNHHCWWTGDIRSQGISNHGDDLVCLENVRLQHQGLHSLSSKTYYCKISWSLEATRFMFRLFQSLWNLTGTSAAVLPVKFQSDTNIIISNLPWLWVFTRSSVRPLCTKWIEALGLLIPITHRTQVSLIIFLNFNLILIKSSEFWCIYMYNILM